MLNTSFIYVRNMLTSFLIDAPEAHPETNKHDPTQGPFALPPRVKNENKKG